MTSLSRPGDDPATTRRGLAVTVESNGIPSLCDVLYATRPVGIITRHGVARSAVVSAMPRIARAAAKCLT
jgi:hypothetical protein